jgi:hypothetical protein
MEVLAALCKNESLETLFMISLDARFGDYLLSVEAIQSNITLMHLWMHDKDFYVNEVETKDLIPVLKQDYGLEAFPGLDQLPLHL